MYEVYLHNYLTLYPRRIFSLEEEDRLALTRVNRRKLILSGTTKGYSEVLSFTDTRLLLRNQV